MPKTFPRAPFPLFSALLAPLAWFYGRPDLFDSYSAGITLLQLSGECCAMAMHAACLPTCAERSPSDPPCNSGAVPELRSMQAARVFNLDLARVDYDLEAWRYAAVFVCIRSSAID